MLQRVCFCSNGGPRDNQLVEVAAMFRAYRLFGAEHVYNFHRDKNGDYLFFHHKNNTKHSKMLCLKNDQKNNWTNRWDLKSWADITTTTPPQLLWNRCRISEFQGGASNMVDKIEFCSKTFCKGNRKDAYCSWGT